jgi:hypothetical protein
MYLSLFVVAPFRSPKISSAKRPIEVLVTFIQGVEIPCQTWLHMRYAVSSFAH